MLLRMTYIFVFLLTFGNLLSGQKSDKKITISGYVVDANHYPVAGAIIMVDNKATNILTDSNGFYSVKTNSTSHKIKIIANITGSELLVMEEPINGLTRINFKFDTTFYGQITYMSDDAGEEEINIGYGSQKKKNLSSPVSKIKVNSKYYRYNSVYDILIELPGVQLQGKSILVQGANSLMSSTEPLFVVDDVIVNSIDYISPKWVKSVEVLKGPSASIYGSRGANGVILINLLSYPDKK